MSPAEPPTRCSACRWPQPPPAASREPARWSARWSVVGPGPPATASAPPPGAWPWCPNGASCARKVCRDCPKTAWAFFSNSSLPSRNNSTFFGSSTMAVAAGLVGVGSAAPRGLASEQKHRDKCRRHPPNRHVNSTWVGHTAALTGLNSIHQSLNACRSWITSVLCSRTRTVTRTHEPHGVCDRSQRDGVRFSLGNLSSLPLRSYGIMRKQRMKAGR